MVYNLRYALSVASHYFRGKITARNALRALQDQPIAVSAKRGAGSLIICPDFHP